MKVIILDKESAAIVSLYNVSSITWADGVTTIVGISHSGDGTVRTFTADRNRYVVRIIEN